MTRIKLDANYSFFCETKGRGCFDDLYINFNDLIEFLSFFNILRKEPPRVKDWKSRFWVLLPLQLFLTQPIQLGQKGREVSGSNDFLSLHRQNYTKEHDFYRKTLQGSSSVNDKRLQHVVLDFAYMVLLDRSLKTSEQLYVVRGSNIVMIKVWNCKGQGTTVFGPSEGNWLYEETTSFALSIFTLCFLQFLPVSFPRTAGSAFSSFIYTLKNVLGKLT